MQPQTATGGLPPDERQSAYAATVAEQTKGMNPVEQGMYQEDQALEYAAYNFPGKPVYKEGDKSYGKKLEAWEEKQAAWYAENTGVTNEQARKLLDEKADVNKTEKEIKREEQIQVEADEWVAKRETVVAEFGKPAARLWDKYNDLEGEARKEFAKANPAIKVYNIAAHNPAEYAEATAIFGKEAWADLASLPVYVDTEEGKAARSKWWQEHQTAKVLNAWVSGRPVNFKELAEGEVWTPTTTLKSYPVSAGISVELPVEEEFHNFGKDYNEALTKFGPDIWQLFAQYDSSWDKRTKAIWFNAHPQYGDFQPWWYGDDGKETTARSSGYGYSRSSRSYSGGGYYGGGGSSDSSSYDRDIRIDPRGLSYELSQDRPQDRVAAWRPSWIDMDNVRPQRPPPMQPWRALPRNQRG
jgi:uncharacterized membrane protein YgcG